jgi:heat shock protein HslJ
MQIHKLSLILAFTLILSLVACSGANASPDLTGTSWTLTEINGQRVLADSNPTLVFEADSAGGHGSCNSFGGDYEAENGKLTFDSIFSTMMYCEDTMEQETAYLAALQDATGYQVKDGNLLILDADGLVTLIFESK